jgi:hypothetical protein
LEGALGYEGGDSSYDYGAAITEDRHVWREKYSEGKLEANFLKVSPAYLTALPGNAANGSTYVPNSDIASTPIFGTEEPPTSFYVVRHADFTSSSNTTYQLHVPTSYGNVTIPQLGGQLSLNGRESKIHVTDYHVGGLNVVYSTAEIFTWARARSGIRVLILYGGAEKTHEFAFPAGFGRPSSEGSTVKIQEVSSTWVVNWQVIPTRQSVTFDGPGLEVQLLWRNDDYDYWVLELPAPLPIGNYSSPLKEHVIIKGGYLLRTASIYGSMLDINGDFNTTTELEIIFEPTGAVEEVIVDGRALNATENREAKLSALVPFVSPEISLPDFTSNEWRYIDSVPEVLLNYDDHMWTVCDHNSTTNDQLGLQTPTSLYVDDYGYHTGSLIYRGHFTATGNETTLFLNISGGSAHGFSVWMDSTFLGSWTGNVANRTYSQMLEVP